MRRALILLGATREGGDGTEEDKPQGRGKSAGRVTAARGQGEMFSGLQMAFS